MFNTVLHTYNEKTKLHTFTGNLGRRFKRTLDKIGVSKQKQKYLFHSLKEREIVIHDFFIPDLRLIANTILNVGSVYDVNFKVIKKIVNIIEQDIIAPRQNRIHLDYDVIKKEFIYEPLESQKPAYEAYERIRGISGNRGMLLDGAVGVGKTYISLTIAEMLHSEAILIVAPLPTINRVWINSLAGEDRLYKNPKAYYDLRSNQPYQGEKYIITHYENLDKVIPLYKEYNINFTTIIVDEVHNFNDIKSKRTKLLIDIVTEIPFEHAIPMSGTPIKASATDLVPLFKIINKDFDNKLMHRFIKVYKSAGHLLTQALKEKYQNYTVVLRKTNMDIPPLSTPTVKVKLKNGEYFTLEAISKRLKEYIEKRTKELEEEFDKYKETYFRLYNQVKQKLLDAQILTEKDFKVYEHNIEVIVNAYNAGNLMNVPEEIKNANKFERTYIEPHLGPEDKVKFREAKTVYKYLALKVQGEALANVVMRARIECYTALATEGVSIRKFVESTTKKTIVFSNYIEVCEAAKEKAISEKLIPITVYGDTTKNLTQHVNMFIHDKKYNPLIATYKSLSTGVPLIVANVIIIFGLPYRQYIFEQAVGRAWRTGQDKPVTAYIIELDTGEKQNITDRDFDIIDFFRKEVSRITGKDDAVVIEKNKQLDIELGLQGLVEPQENYLAQLIKTQTDILTRWFK